ncbi:hypothetical protein BDW42DRAFT_170198 [Aspergillus taichungensis]|uniref:Uncharacterized protein n=1 Tax=Aspergillus taichungensis TaxID=482145 RepID=A0A2J5HTW9_9EURO|nr:hypothetical protein BDW42DRAFT_170198 [Aspergillus taichungensis]
MNKDSIPFLCMAAQAIYLFSDLLETGGMSVFMLPVCLSEWLVGLGRDFAAWCK